MTNVKDVVSPAAFHWFQIFGYGVFVAAWVVIVFYFVAATSTIVKSAVALSTKTVPPAASPNPARRDPAKVLLFPAEVIQKVKTRNRLVIQ